MSTDLSEKALETLIVDYLTSDAGGWLAGDPKDYDREYAVDLVQLTAFLQATQPEKAEALDLDHDSPTRRKFLARLQGEITKRGVIDVLRKGIKHGPHRRRPVLRHAVARQRQGRRALRRQPLQRHPAAALQPGRDAAGPRPGPVHQRPAGRHLRAEEQPHQADGRGCRRAVQARPRSAGAAVPVRPLHGPLRRGRPGGALLHRAEGQGVVVPAVRPGLQRRRRQPAQPRRPQDRLPLEADPHASGPDQHPRELRPDRRREGRRRPARRSSTQIFPRYHQLDVVRKLLADGAAARRRAALPDPALGRQRQVQLHRLAGPPADRPGARRQARCSTRSSWSPTARILDKQIQRHDQAVRPGRRDGRPRRALGRPARGSSRAARRSSSRRCRSSRSSSRRSATSTAAARSPSSSTRPTPARAGKRPRPDERGAVGGRRARRTTRRPRTPSTASWSRARCCPTPATSPSPPRRRTRRWRSSASRTPRAARPSTGRSTATR